MKKVDGFWWPDWDVEARRLTPEHAAQAVPRILELVKSRGVVVQAGGNAGCYPVALADHFREVYTFEPEPDLHECLRRNVDDRGLTNVRISSLALSDEIRTTGLAYVHQNAGATNTRGSSQGKYQMAPLDNLRDKSDAHILESLDLIALDVAGDELRALQGAAELIEKHRPAIVVAESFAGRDEAIAWVLDRGYRDVAVVPQRDHVLLPR